MCYITGWQIRSKNGLTMYRKEHNNKQKLQMRDSQRKRTKEQNNDLQNITQKSTDRITRTPLKTGVNSDTPEDLCKLL
jgi:hypothetical protein